MDRTLTNDIGDSRDWALRLLVHRQQLRLQLGHPRRALRARATMAKQKGGALLQTSALACLAAAAEQLCANPATLEQL